MEQISETRTSLAAEFAAQLRHDGGYDEIADYIEESAALRDELSQALTAARIEGERQGLERAIERLEKRAEASITHSAEQQIRWDIKALYDLIAKDTPHDH